ncbi:thioredoxin-like protein [Entophlyctis helioformis]|nr:thioredoxin-like protein [Entophlyctis helioformis]
MVVAKTKSNVNDVTTDEHFATLVAAQPVSVLNFWAEWHEPCKDMNDVFDELSRKYPVLSFIRLEAENFPDVSESYEIATVPTFIVLRQGKIAERIEGANAPALSTAVEKYAKTASALVPPTSAVAPAAETTPASAAEAKAALDKKLGQLIASQPVMLFMKGTPSEPRCGFSRQTVEILTKVGCPYGSFNILADETVREALKEYSNWPTYPQLYVNGELVGGLDILKELVESGEFQQMVPKEEDLNTRLGKLVRKAPVMLFMKGSPSTPRCGFSRQLVKLLDEQCVAYETFDILEDEEIRQGLKEYSNWPTYPQLYAKGELVGGLDIVKELIELGEFKSTVG